LAADALITEVNKLPDDPNWLVAESRRVICWDEEITSNVNINNNQKALPLLVAPELNDMMSRCKLEGFQPPVIRVPMQLPVPLPSVDPKDTKKNKSKSKCMYPADPEGGRLGIAVLSKLGYSIQNICSEYDVISGTSFIKALTGDTTAANDTFYLQRFGYDNGDYNINNKNTSCVCVLHSPSHYRSQEDVGHAVERVLCGGAEAEHDPGSFEAASSLKICSKYRFLVMSEVDATNKEGVWCEMKSSATKNEMRQFLQPKTILQTAVNGSEYIVAGLLNKEKTQLQEVKWFPLTDQHSNNEKHDNTNAVDSSSSTKSASNCTSEETRSTVLRSAAVGVHVKTSFITQGKRLKLLLDRVLNNELLKNLESNSAREISKDSNDQISDSSSKRFSRSGVIKLTFDETKAPVMELVHSKSRIEVLPLGMEEICGKKEN